MDTNPMFGLNMAHAVVIHDFVGDKEIREVSNS